MRCDFSHASATSTSPIDPRSYPPRSLACRPRRGNYSLHEAWLSELDYSLITRFEKLQVEAWKIRSPQSVRADQQLYHWNKSAFPQLPKREDSVVTRYKARSYSTMQLEYQVTSCQSI